MCIKTLNGCTKKFTRIMKNKNLNLYYFVVSFLILAIILIMHKLFLIKVDKQVYYMIIGTSIAALGNYIVIRIQMKRKQR